MKQAHSISILTLALVTLISSNAAADTSRLAPTEQFSVIEAPLAPSDEQQFSLIETDNAALEVFATVVAEEQQDSVEGVIYDSRDAFVEDKIEQEFLPEELEEMFLSDETPSTEADAPCDLSKISLFIGKRDSHLFMCAEITYSCKGKPDIVKDVPFGATNKADAADCAARPRPANVQPFNADLQGKCDKDLVQCLGYINEVGTKYNGTHIGDIIIAPINGAPCRNAVLDFICLLKTGKLC